MRGRSTWRLAATFGDLDLVREHLTAAVTTCEALHALPFQALALAELGAVGDKHAAARAHSLASRLGMAPLLARRSGGRRSGRHDLHFIDASPAEALERSCRSRPPRNRTGGAL